MGFASIPSWQTSGGFTRQPDHESVKPSQDAACKFTGEHFMSMVKSRREYLLKVPTHLLTQVLQHLGTNYGFLIGDGGFCFVSFFLGWNWKDSFGFGNCYVKEFKLHGIDRGMLFTKYAAMMMQIWWWSAPESKTRWWCLTCFVFVMQPRPCQQTSLQSAICIELCKTKIYIETVFAAAWKWLAKNPHSFEGQSSFKPSHHYLQQKSSMKLESLMFNVDPPKKTSLTVAKHPSFTFHDDEVLPQSYTDGIHLWPSARNDAWPRRSGQHINVFLDMANMHCDDFSGWSPNFSSSRDDIFAFIAGIETKHRAMRRSIGCLMTFHWACFEQVTVLASHRRLAVGKPFKVFRYYKFAIISVSASFQAQEGWHTVHTYYGENSLVLHMVLDGNILMNHEDVVIDIMLQPMLYGLYPCSKELFFFCLPKVFQCAGWMYQGKPGNGAIEISQYCDLQRTGYQRIERRMKV